MTTIAAELAAEETTPVSAPIARPKARARVVFVDVLRLVALLQMVNGHTLDAVMVDELRRGPVFDRYVYLRGLVSVAFMVASGFAYHLTTFARFDAHRADPAARRHRVRRAVLLVAMGYGLRVSSGLWSGDPALVARCLAALARVDVLHTIGVSLLALEIVTMLSRSLAQARAIAVALACLLLALAPLGATLPVDAISQWWVDWVGHQGGSLFPITPWGAYVLLGAALGGTLIPAGAPERAPVRLAIAAVIASALSLVIGVLPLPVGIAHASEPGFVVEKLGVVLAIVAGIAWLTRRVTDLRPTLRVLAGETLVVYVFHFVALYWTRLGPARVFPHTLALPEALAVSSAMVALSFGVGLAAPRIRTLARGALESARAR